jgi:putative nucleotidyltransferase with HDIG domain
MIAKERAVELLNKHLESENLKKHCIASGAIMKALAARLGRDTMAWEVTGLLHDLDFDKTRDEPEKHAIETVNLLSQEDVPEEYLYAIKSHNEMTGFKRKSELDYALASSESMTGLVVACAMVYPDKKITSVKPKSIKKRMKEKAFARNVSRENIQECELIGVPLDEFIELSLQAMGEIEGELIS